MNEKQIKGNRFHEVMMRYQEAIYSMGNSFLIMGECLRDIKQESLWRLDGNQNITFRMWVEGELRISYSQAMRLIQVFECTGHLLCKPEYRGIDIYKVVLLLPDLTGKTDEEKEEMLHQAQTLKINDLKNNIKESKGILSSDNCDHINNEAWNRCVRCSKFWR